MKTLTGHFLLSMPKLRGTLFGDSVIYLWAHGKEGAQGIIVNHLYDLTVGKLLEQLQMPSVAAIDDPVAAGGPVEPQRGFIIHTDDVRVEASEDAGDGLAVSYSRDILELIAAGKGPRQFLVALGYSGWGPGQLEGELTDSAWLTAPGARDVIFDVPFDQRLDRVAQTIGVDFRLLGSDAGLA